MPLFNYKAKDAKGGVVEDTIQAANKDNAAVALKSQGFTILTLKAVHTGSVLFGGKISTSEKAAFCRFLATMLRSGMSLPEAVEIIREETKNKKMQKVLGDISYQTQKGKSLSAVLSEYKHDFDPIFLTMVKVGEESGTLEKSFDYLAKQLTKSHELSQTVKGSMMYPAVIVLAMIGNGLMMGVFVLPRIASVFLKLNVPLPVYTKVVLNLGQFLGKNTVLVIVGTIVGTIGFVALFFFGPTRRVIITVLSKMPVVKTVVKYIDVARYARTLATLLHSGVPIIDSLEVSADGINQPWMRVQAKKIGERVSKGESLSNVLTQNKKLFPTIMVQTIRAGEKSGSLEQVLGEVAEFYESEVEHSLKKLTSLLEPLLMLLVGVVVGVMVIMMIAPIYSIIGGLQSTVSGQGK